jgi:acyl-CoA synthetase (NDP forming)
MTQATEQGVKCEDYGFLRPFNAVAQNVDEATRLAKIFGFPAVLKISSPDVIHKTDVGGVELDLDTEQAVRAAYCRILSRVGEKMPQARIDGVSVEETCKEGVEIIIGLNNDAQFGPVVMFGLGGIFAEILRDVSFRVLPIDEDDAANMIHEIKGFRILRGYRGQPPVQTDMLIELLMKANRMGRAGRPARFGGFESHQSLGR